MRDVRSLIIMPSGEGLNSLNKNNRAELSGKKKDSKSLRPLRIREKNLKSNCPLKCSRPRIENTCT